MKEIDTVISKVSKAIDSKDTFSKTLERIAIENDISQAVVKKQFSEFLRNFYSLTQVRDFENYTTDELCNLVLLSYSLFLKRGEKEVKIKVYNSYEDSGNIFIKGDDYLYTIIDVLHRDMPFLIDSMTIFLENAGVKIKNVIQPIYNVKRDAEDNLVAIVKDASEGGAKILAESLTQFHISKITSKEEVANIKEGIAKILDTVALVVDDWKEMIGLADKAKAGVDHAKKYVNDCAEIKEFISWMSAGNFILLGAREFSIKQVSESDYELQPVVENTFGVFRTKYDELRPLVMNSSFVEVSDSIKNPYVIEILKSRYKSCIHRNVNAERIRIQKISASGEVVGEYRFVGLFTSSAYNHSANSIPLIRNKIKQVIVDSGYVADSHNYKDLVSILESYPRDELFQITNTDLLRIATGIVLICNRLQIRFFSRQDKFGRFVSCLIFVPRVLSNSDMREKIKDYLEKAYNGVVADSFVQINESKLVRFHVIIRTDNGASNVDATQIEKEITKMVVNWLEDLKELLHVKFDSKAAVLFEKYKDAFSLSYTDKFNVRRAVIDIEKIEECLQKNTEIFSLYRNDDVAELKIYSSQKELTLSNVMPILESFGFHVIQEHTYLIKPSLNGNLQSQVWIHDFHLNLSNYDVEFSEKIRQNFTKMMQMVWKKECSVGSLNSLVVAADLDWKKIYMLRAYVNYIYQIGFRYSQNYVSEVLVKYSNITKLLVELFEAKFDPSLKLSFEERVKLMESINERIKEGLTKVKDLTEDAVIRKILAVINATLRTNYYQTISEGVNKGRFLGRMSFKFDSKKIPDLPLPVPYAEIFVYSAGMQGIHLRGGKVARGGLRWSDRHEDFRTEILGLVKAQMTKNAVIVPVGSKGGFIVKKSTIGLSREEILKDGVEAYKSFLRGILDVTDNVVSGKVVHPRSCIMHDAADPYLVVAADKGTATFSDIANSISAEYGFWLGDAFASGGSVGYDHKKMGITAKGGWVSVKRHFSEMGVDIDKQDFTCIGIGDLAGDVFGNGMLLSNHIKLIAAFNHMHIFLDPNPDAAKSFAERQRMFNLPRSTWLDYNQSLISEGGGIFERSAKTIKLSPQVKVVLDVEDDELAPNDLIKIILKTPADLLWNGGIGTYVKASDETHIDVGDRTNDVLRINGSELRCKIVGEGGNLGFTQKGRIEYALNGGRINTDAMDNSAGVDCSDHEVNIKIALIAAMRGNKITLEERNKVLESMTDEVGHLVLEDNRLQTQAISIAFAQKEILLNEQSQFMDEIERSNLLNRAVEFLPSHKDIEKRMVAKTGLTRPELCVLLAYSKMDIYNHLVTSNLIKDKYFDADLIAYFPSTMQQKFGDELLTHQLRNEIIATQITNLVVNRTGITFVNRICRDSGYGISEVVRSVIIAIDSFRLKEVWLEIEKFDGKISAEIQFEMYFQTIKLLERSVLWLLRNQLENKSDLATIVKHFRAITDNLSSIVEDILAQASRESYERRIDRYVLNGVDKKLARTAAAIDPLASVFDIAEISSKSKLDLKIIAKIYFAVGTRFSLRWLRGKVSNVSAKDNWQRLSAKNIVEELYSYQVRIAQAIATDSLQNGSSCDAKAMSNWVAKNALSVQKYDAFVSELKTQMMHDDLSPFIVALGRIKLLIN